MRDVVLIVLAKAVRALARIRGGGSALPGLMIEKLDPTFLARVLDRLPLGVVVISGTNGKTTTTKIVTELLSDSGLRVFTNKTGSNFTRGVVAALVADVSVTGRLDADIAVLELDEAHAMSFIERVKPRYTLLLNVLRDQLDRFGEIDTTAKYLARIGMATTGALVVNADDELVSRIGHEVQGVKPDVEIVTFGVDPTLAHLFVSDSGLYGAHADTAQPGTGATNVVLDRIDDHDVTLRVDGQSFTVRLALDGVYNFLNAAAGLALVRTILGAAADDTSLVQSLARVSPAFGRGERVIVDGDPVELVLVKNPAGFRLALASYEHDDAKLLIAINDNAADGRDTSWLWDVEFARLQRVGVEVVTGSRAWEMALRLEHDDVACERVIEPIEQALEAFLSATTGHSRRIFCTYTAMLELRKLIAKQAEVQAVW